MAITCISTGVLELYKCEENLEFQGLLRLKALKQATETKHDELTALSILDYFKLILQECLRLPATLLKVKHCLI